MRVVSWLYTLTNFRNEPRAEHRTAFHAVSTSAANRTVCGRKIGNWVQSKEVESTLEDMCRACRRLINLGPKAQPDYKSKNEWEFNSKEV